MFSTQTILTNIPKTMNIFLKGYNHFLHTRQPEINILQNNWLMFFYKRQGHDRQRNTKMSDWKRLR